MIAGWWGYFEGSGHPLLARFGGLIFTVLEDGRLVFDMECSSFMSIPWSCIRNVGRKGKHCLVDPLIVLCLSLGLASELWEGKGSIV